MGKRRLLTKYLLSDYLTALLSWCIFFFYRKTKTNPYIFEYPQEVISDKKLWLGLLVLPLFWLLLYYLVGSYRKLYRKARLNELWVTFTTSLIGVFIIFFILILDDDIITYRSYYTYAFFLFCLHFTLTFTLRLIITTSTVRKVHRGEISFKTLLVGNNGSAITTLLEIRNQVRSSGNEFVGFVSIHESAGNRLKKFLPCLGSIKDIEQVIKDNNIEEVIIATEKSEKQVLETIITSLETCGNIIIKIKADLNDILLGKVKTSGVFEVPLITIYPDVLPVWQQSLKRVVDIVLSSLAIIILLPVYIITAIGVKLSSKGPILFKQERIGKGGVPFQMHKFRSMYLNAEIDGVPRLSKDDDPRITPFGKFMRKVRLDEIPQFFTVIKGDMSLVGPRPERKYFIDKISKRAPQYRVLHKIKPGITSWGQVKYGYASDVDQMIERMKYDLLYLENMSLFVDLKILIHTIIIVFQGRGK